MIETNSPASTANETRSTARTAVPFTPNVFDTSSTTRRRTLLSLQHDEGLDPAGPADRRERTDDADGRPGREPGGADAEPIQRGELGRDVREEREPAREQHRQRAPRGADEDHLEEEQPRHVRLPRPDGAHEPDLAGTLVRDPGEDGPREQRREERRDGERGEEHPRDVGEGLRD